MGVDVWIAFVESEDSKWRGRAVAIFILMEKEEPQSMKESKEVVDPSAFSLSPGCLFTDRIFYTLGMEVNNPAVRIHRGRVLFFAMASPFARSILLDSTVPDSRQTEKSLSVSLSLLWLSLDLALPNRKHSVTLTKSESRKVKKKKKRAICQRAKHLRKEWVASPTRFDRKRRGGRTRSEFEKRRRGSINNTSLLSLLKR